MMSEETLRRNVEWIRIDARLIDHQQRVRITATSV